VGFPLTFFQCKRIQHREILCATLWKRWYYRCHFKRKNDYHPTHQLKYKPLVVFRGFIDGSTKNCPIQGIEIKTCINHAVNSNLCIKHALGEMRSKGTSNERGKKKKKQARHWNKNIMAKAVKTLTFNYLMSPKFPCMDKYNGHFFARGCQSKWHFKMNSKYKLHFKMSPCFKYFTNPKVRSWVHMKGNKKGKWKRKLQLENQANWAMITAPHIREYVRLMHLLCYCSRYKKIVESPSCLLEKNVSSTLQSYPKFTKMLNFRTAVQRREHIDN